MAIIDRIHPVHTTNQAPSARSMELMAGTLLVALVTALGIGDMLPADALAPAVVTLLFAVGAATAVLALICRRSRFRILLFDLAGGLTFVGIVISVLIEPDQFVRLFALSDQSE